MNRLLTTMAIAAAVLCAQAATASAAQAGPARTADAGLVSPVFVSTTASHRPAASLVSSSIDVTAKPMSQDDAMNAILRTNPTARRVGLNAVNVAPGIDVIYGAVRAGATTGSSAAVVPSAPTSNLCYAYYLCVWEHAITGGFGYGLALYYCNPPGTMLDLNRLRYPDGAAVGPGPNANRWNDRISSYENAQSTGTTSRFYNWRGYWDNVRNSTAFDYKYNLKDVGINDIVDGLHVC